MVGFELLEVAGVCRLVGLSVVDEPGMVGSAGVVERIMEFGTPLADAEPLGPFEVVTALFELNTRVVSCTGSLLVVLLFKLLSVARDRPSSTRG